MSCWWSVDWVTDWLTNVWYFLNCFRNQTHSTQFSTECGEYLLVSHVDKGRNAVHCWYEQIWEGQGEKKVICHRPHRLVSWLQISDLSQRITLTRSHWYFTYGLYLRTQDWSNLSTSLKKYLCLCVFWVCTLIWE